MVVLVEGTEEVRASDDVVETEYVVVGGVVEDTEDVVAIGVSGGVVVEDEEVAGDCDEELFRPLS
jgi:hypothetical protein